MATDIETSAGTEATPEPSTFRCRCGDSDVEYLLELGPDDEDPSTWCECGLRIDAQREHALRVQDASR